MNPLDAVVEQILPRVDPESENTYVVGVKLVEASVMDTDRIARLEESEQLRRRTRGEGG